MRTARASKAQQCLNLFTFCQQKIERFEQQRLQNIMHYHSDRSHGNLQDHPWSIVAGIEMGSLNRYTNVWPFGK